MEFTFATAGRISFGAGVARTLPEVVVALGERALVVTGAHPERHAGLLDGLNAVASHRVLAEPTMDDARQAVQTAREAGAGVVVAVGGGSVIDLAKAVGVLVHSDGDPMDHAEVIGAGRPLPDRGLPVVALPTTAGTGAEVTRNAVLTSPEHRVKVSLRSEAMLPRVALVDPELTLDCPPGVTASSGMDALTQCIEPLTSHAANPLTDGFARTGLAAAARGLRLAYLSPDDLSARTDMSLCALMGGLSLANAKLGAVHGLAGAIGGLTGAPHGAVCAALLPSVTMANVAALRDREPENPALDRYAEVAQLLCGVPEVEAAVEWIEETVRVLDIGGLADLGLRDDQVAEAVASGARSSSMKGNPIELGTDELTWVVENAM